MNINKFHVGDLVRFKKECDWGKSASWVGIHKIIGVGNMYVYISWDSYIKNLKKRGQRHYLEEADIKRGAGFYPESLELVSNQLMLFDI